MAKKAANDPQTAVKPAKDERAAQAPQAAASRGQASVLFTAFEPSGDALAAPVIRELIRIVPKLKVYAWGGPKMQAAGATILGRTTDDAAMGLSSAKRALAVRREIKRIKEWSRQYRVLALVAVDSPAANFPICKAVKKSGARIVHLAAPQLWAWAPGRIRKLRRLTDLVLCLLPFEEQYFKDRDVPAKFIGHPAMNRPLDQDELREHMHGLPQGAPRVAIFPGSRAQEVRANMRLLANAFVELQGRHSGMAGVIVAASPEMAKIVRRKVKVFPSHLHMITGNAEGAIAWADLCLAVSGTVSLEITRQRKPMIGVYKTSLSMWLLSKLILRSPYRLLPNIIADREIVPEFIPHIGGAMPIVKQASKYLLDSKNMANQSEELNRVCLRFSGKKPAEEATRLIVQVIKDGMLQESKAKASPSPSGSRGSAAAGGPG